ncbi:hypothetical protein RND71_008576 [Anisodus tanguticus]|uniref:Pentatricopeptide repeat-containing protein n=1 Tax=Anisodus tanguticus TaxID=243964 RepID=A0AAE1VL61_9SOLA|nr:hypothetical protein RND71_008576 [Anisodus tanguticus]
MISQGIKENSSTLSSILSICANTGLYKEGVEIHSRVVVLGCNMNLYIASSLVNMYIQMGLVIVAFKSFYDLPKQNLPVWNLVLRGICELGRSTNALVDFYSACGALVDADKAFECIPPQDVISWNSMVSVSAANDLLREAVRVLEEMRLCDKHPSAMSFVALLNLSSRRKELLFGKQIHNFVVKLGVDYGSALIQSALIDISGQIRLSEQIFEALPSPNIIGFTSIINAYARKGMGSECLGMFEEMIRKGVKPDEVTFLCILLGCNHSGLVEEGKKIFDSMRTLHEVYPDRRHYSCMVDLLGPAGLVDEAEELLNHASSTGDSVMWSSLLRSCRIHQNEDVGRREAKTLMDLEPEDPSVWLQASIFFS